MFLLLFQTFFVVKRFRFVFNYFCYFEKKFNDFFIVFLFYWIIKQLNIFLLNNFWKVFFFFSQVTNLILLTELIMIILLVILFVIMICHQYRWIVIRRVFFCTALCYTFRAFCIVIIQVFHFKILYFLKKC